MPIYRCVFMIVFAFLFGEGRTTMTLFVIKPPHETSLHTKELFRQKKTWGHQDFTALQWSRMVGFQVVA